MQLPEDALHADPTRAAGDLGPLAWVLEELRKVLGGAGKTLRRFAREADAARADGVAPPAVTLLSAVPQQLYQSAGALEMVDQSSAAVLLRSMESTVNAFLRRPELCTENAAATMERAGAALIEYLETVLARKAVSAVCLFPQYRDVTELVEGDSAHPADLWTMQWRWAEPRLKPAPTSLEYDATTRSLLDHAVLKIVKSADPQAAREVALISLGLAAGQSAQRPSIFWQISAAFFEALSHGLVPADLYVKRLASRILMQFSSLARGDEDVPQALVRDLLFYCAHARADDAAAPVLAAVREAFGLNRVLPVEYEMRRFGRFDPAHLAQARRRIHSAAESWSQVAGGDTAKLRLAGEHFRLLSEAMLQLQPESIELAHALQAAASDALRAGRPPSPALAMEVATSVLYLQAAYDDLDQDDSRLSERVARLAGRLEQVRAGGQPEPLESWMEELYRKVSDRQTMGSVVEEMRAGLASVEKSLDQFFRDTSDSSPLGGVSSQLSQMRGVMSVLGLNQASHAVMRMRDSVDRFMAGDQRTLDNAEPAFEKLGNSLGALGFLVDMLSYQPALAKKMFVYDEEAGELRPVMGRTTTEQVVPSHAVHEAAPELPVQAMAEPEAPFDSPTLPPEMADEAEALAQLEQVEWAAPVEPEPSEQTAETASANVDPGLVPAEEPQVVDAELLEIFLEEAREVVANGLASIELLAKRQGDASEQTALRRAFHTLKGSSRMVGLNSFGEAAWSMEQLHNSWLADQKSVDQPILELSRSALQAFGVWASAIEQGTEARWTSADFRTAADALRLENRVVELGGMRAVEEAVELPPELSALDVAEPTEIEAHSPEMVEDASDAAPEEIGELTEQLPLDATGQREVDLALDWFEPAAELPEAQLPEAELPQEAESHAAHLGAAELEAHAAQSLDAENAANFDRELPAETEAAAADEEFKIIGDLRVGIPLYQVYLSEADEWSRRLSTDLSEWALYTSQPVPESAIAMAHSIAGISGTVGFTSLSMLARTLERALGHAQLLGNGAAGHAQAFVDASNEVNRLLHQFAAGFLKDADPQVLSALEEVLNTEGHSLLAAMDLREQQADAGAGESDEIETIAPESVLPETVEVPEAQELQELQAHDEATPVEEERIDAVASAEEPVAAEESTVADEAIIFEPARTVLAGAAIHTVQNLDDDIDAVDAIDPDLFPIFEDEAVELLPKLAGALRQWVATPDDEGARSESLRVLHTLKGSARLAGALRLGEMAHRMESDIAIHAGEVPAASQIEPLLGRLDTIHAQLDQLRNAPVAAQATVEEVRVHAGAQPAELSAATGEVQPASVMVPVAASQVSRLGAQSVRVRSQVLDRLVNQAGEIMMSRSRLETRIAQLRDSMSDLSGNLDRLRQQLRDVELQAETQMQSRLALSKESGGTFDPLEFDRFTRVQELTRMMAESVNDVATVQRSVQRSVEGAEDDLVAQARQSRELQRDLLRTRMVEFEGISERLYAVVRQASKETGKQVRLDITGGTIEMDRGMLDRLTPAFEHLLRNAVAHGIETPEARVGAGKAQAGTIAIELTQAGNDVAVRFRDDGQGLDLKRIREIAVERGQASAFDSLSDAEASQLIFMPGFSTSNAVTELAGRGIGMDVVRSEVTGLGGRIDIDSSAGLGTGFTMVLPLTTAVTQIVMVRAGEQTVGVPAAVVELLRRVPSEDVEASLASGDFSYAGETIPFYWCGSLLQSSAKSVEPAAKMRQVLIIRSASQRIAMQVDQVLGTHEVVVKNLGPQLAKLPGLAGMSTLASGQVALIYNPVALANVYGHQARHWAQAQETAVQGGGQPQATAMTLSDTPQAPLVLVVDDSITVRRVTQRLLQREGYRVALAADGLQAIERLQEEMPVMVLSDIEMPRMDGFDLARNIRGDAAMAHLPIVMITSRIGDKHREHAMDLGIQHYLGKPYSEDELLRLLRHYTARARGTNEVLH